MNRCGIFGLHQLSLLVAAVLLVAGSLSTAGAQTAGASELERAYKREFAFLEAEKHTLQQRIAALQSVQTQKIEQVRSVLEQLQAQAMNASLLADRHQDQLLEFERQAAEVTEGADLVDSLIFQVDTLLTQEGEQASLPQGNEKDPKLESSQHIQLGFDRALKLLAEAGSVRRVSGSYFAENGRKVEGEILKLGEIAAYGLAPGALGALAPAGAGRLKVWPEAPGAASAEIWSAGTAPPVLSLFLYDSLDKPVERRAEPTAVEVIASGGMIGWVIVAGGAVALLLALLRIVLLAPNNKGARRLMEELSPLVQAHHFERARAVASAHSGAVGRVLARTLSGITQPQHELENIIDEAVLHEQPTLDRFGSAIFVIAAVAPLLGLLGTVTGMIATFDIITEFGTGNPKLLSGGISIALVTTELGLIVAIPALIMGNFLNGWAERIKGDLDHTALRVVNLAHGAQLTDVPPGKRPSLPQISAPALVAT